MANVLITETCVRSCPYCFAKEYMVDKKQNLMTWKNMVYIADLHKAEGEHISLLGGEPSLHPDFVNYILYLDQRNIHVNVFTSGIMSDLKLEEMAQHLLKIDPQRLSFVVNLNHPSISPPREMDRVEKFFRLFGNYTSLSFNIYQEDFDIDFLFETILKYGLKRSIRFGLAQPIPGEKNLYISKDRLPVMVEKLMSYADKFERLGVHVGFDCGMPMCLFSDEDIGKLYKLSNTRINFGCGPAIDFGTDMSVWACFPLSGYNKKKISDFENLREIRHYYDNLHNKLRAEAGGIYSECDECVHRKKRLCAGGCLAHVVSDIKNEPVVRFEDLYDFEE